MSKDTKTTRKTRAPKKSSFSPFSKPVPDKKVEEASTPELSKSIPPPPPPPSKPVPVVSPAIKPIEKSEPVAQPKPVAQPVVSQKSKELIETEKRSKIESICKDLMNNRFFILPQREAMPLAAAMVNESPSALLRQKRLFSYSEKQTLHKEIVAKYELK